MIRKEELGISIVFIVLILSTGLLVNSVNAQTEKEFIGKYFMSIYAGGGSFSGSTEWRTWESDESITTYFGIVQPVTILERSDTRLYSSSGINVDIEDWLSYADEDGYLVKTTSHWEIHVQNITETISETYEFGNYQVLEENETVYEIRYTERYENQNSIWIDRTIINGTAEIEVEAGTYDCVVLITHSYQDGQYRGYTLNYVEESGRLIEESVYDEDDDLIAHTHLSSEESDLGALSTDTIFMIIFGGIGIAIIIGIIYIRETSSSTETPRIRDDYRSRGQDESATN